MFNLEGFHQYCASGNLTMIKQFEDIPSLYESIPVEKKGKIVNGLFWSVIFGQFKVAKYLIEEKIFDINKLICGELHILHILATIGGRDNEVSKNMNQYYILFESYFKNKDYAPMIFDNEGFIYIENYDKKKVLEFTKYVIEKCDVNMSVRTQKKWWVLEQSQASQWITFYKIIISKLANDLNISYSRYDFTPFHLACLFGYKEMVQMFVEYGCDILCMKCKSICKECPYVMKVFLERHEEVDTCLDIYFDIGYTKEELEEMEEKEITFEIDEISNYLENDVFWFLFEEQCLIPCDSLQYDIIEIISDKIYNGEYIENLKYLPKSILKDIREFIDFKYFSNNYSEMDYNININNVKYNFKHIQPLYTE